MANPLFEQIWNDGYVKTRAGDTVQYEAGVSAEFCEALAEEVARLKAPRVLEIGMAFGASSVHLADGIAAAGGGSLTAVDPFQSSDWRGIGIHNVEQAGHNSLLRVIEEPSFKALPRLLADGEEFDFIFIDGNHDFDHVFVDLFYADRLLVNGGMMVFDDCGQRPVSKAIRYLEAHRPYELVRTVSSTRVAWRRLRRQIYRRLRGILHALPLSLQSNMVSEPVSFDQQGRFYRKRREESAAPNHYVPF